MPVNVKQIEDAWCTRKLNNLVINNTIVASVKHRVSCHFAALISFYPYEYFYFLLNYSFTDRSHFFLFFWSETISSSPTIVQVKLVGQIYNKQTDEYKRTFRFVDCTGAINASIWFTYGRAELDAVRYFFFIP
jgi:hypothetical protein